MSESKARRERTPAPARRDTVRLQRALALLVVTLLALPALVLAKGGEQELRFQQLTLAMGGHEVGTTTSRDVKTSEGFRFERQSDLSLRRGAAELKIETRTVAHTDQQLRPLRYRFERKDASGTAVTEGVVRGDHILVRTTQAGATVENRVPLEAGLTFSSAFEHRVHSELASLAKSGHVLKAPVLVEDMGAVTPMEVRVERDGDGYRVSTKMVGMESIDQVDAAGRTLLSRTAALDAVAYPLGSPPPPSVQPGAVDLLARSTWSAPRLASAVTRVRFRIHTPDAKTFAVPEDERQKVVARTASYVDVEVRDVPSRRRALSSSEKTSMTAATPYEPIADARLKEAVAEVTKGAESEREKVDRLVAFVFRHVEHKALDRGYAPALATLQSARGDCTEHSVLLSALLRTAGIPTRLVDGVIVDGGRAGYHEWVEVQVGGDLVPADPTFGAFPAGPERLKLAEGSSSPEGLLSLGVAAGRLLRPGVKVEVVDATPPPSR